MLEGDIKLYRMCLKIAEKYHRGQTRRSNKNIPYIVHPVRSANIVQLCGGGIYQQCGALLHDVIEDTNCTYDKLRSKGVPEPIINIVKDLTDDEKAIASIGKSKYHAKRIVEMCEESRLVKLCERLDNLQSRPSKKMLDGTKDMLKALYDIKLSPAEQSIVLTIFSTINSAEILMKG